MGDENKEKRKNEEKNYETEWSFSFEKIGEKISEVFASMGEEVRHETFTAPFGSTKSAHIKLAGCVGRLTIYPLENSEDLFVAETAFTGELDFRTETNEKGETTVTLKPKHLKDPLGYIRQGFGALGKHEELYWKVGINPNAVLYVDLDGLVGPTEANLASFNITRLDVDGNVGPIKIKLPETDHPYDVNLKGSVGQTTVYAAATKGVRLDADGTVGQTVLNIPSGAAMHIDVDGGVGQTLINVGHGVALRIEAKGGIGGVQVPKGLNKLKGSEDFVTKSGVWESSGFALNTQQVIIKYNGGVGGFRVNQEEVEIV